MCEYMCRYNNFFPTEGAKFEMYAHWPLNINVHLLPVSVGVGAKG